MARETSVMDIQNPTANKIRFRILMNLRKICQKMYYYTAN